MNILALEASTTSAKALLYSGDRIKAIYSQGYKRTADGSLLLHPDDVLQTLFNVGRIVAEHQQIDMISLGSTWHSLILCDKNMQPITKEFSWQYTGASTQAAKIRSDTDMFNHIYHTTGCLVHSAYPAYKVIQLKEDGVDVASSIVTDLGSYIHYALTSQHLVSACTASGSAFMDINTLSYSEFMLDLSGINVQQLPQIASYDKLCLLNEASAIMLGVKSGTPVTLAFADGGLNQVASCGRKKGGMTMSVGTSGALRMATDEPRIPNTPGSWCYYSPISYLVGAATSGACNCVDWVKNSFFSKDIKYSELEEHPVKRDGLPIFLPFLFSERSPGWNDKAKGGFVDLLPCHGPVEMFHSVLEGVLYNIRQCYDIVESVADEPTAILISGGITKSPIWLQMASDIMQKELLIDTVEQASVMGGVYVAQMISGIEPTTASVYKKIIPQNSYEQNYIRYLDAYNNQYN